MATRTINTELVLSGEKTFNDQMKAVNSNLKNLKAEMKLVNEEFADNEGSLEALTAKQKTLSELYEQQKAKVAGFENELQRVTEAYGENSAQADKMKASLLSSKAEMLKYSRELNEVETALEQMENAAEDAAPALDDVGDEAKKAGDKAKDAEKDFSGFGEGMKKVGEIGLQAAAGLATLAVAGVTAVTAAAVEAAENGDPAFAGLAENLTSLKAASTSAKAALGGILLPILEELSGEGAALLNDFSAAMAGTGGDTEKMGRVLSEYIVKGIGLIREQLPEFMSLGGDLIGALGEGIIENAPELLDSGLEAAQQLLDGLEAAAPQLGPVAAELISTLLNFLLQNAPNLVSTGLVFVGQLISGLADSSPELSSGALLLIQELLMALISNAPLLVASGIELVLGILQGFLEALPQFGAQSVQLLETLDTAFGSMIDSVIAIGADIVSGIWQGIQNGWGNLIANVKQLFKDLLQAAKDETEIASPSRLWDRELGRQLGYGVGRGWTTAMQEVKRQIAADLSPENFSTAIDFNGYSDRSRAMDAGFAAGQRIVYLTFNAKQITEADMRMIVRVVNEELGEAI